MFTLFATLFISNVPFFLLLFVSFSFLFICLAIYLFGWSRIIIIMKKALLLIARIRINVCYVNRFKWINKRSIPFYVSVRLLLLYLCTRIRTHSRKRAPHKANEKHDNRTQMQNDRCESRQPLKPFNRYQDRSHLYIICISHENHNNWV